MARGARLIILGKQGAGKGTQCVRLCQHYDVPHISTGDIFRGSVRSGSEAGSQLDEYMRAGELVPDDVVVDIVRERLEQDDTKEHGFVLDGFPRTTYQAQALADLLDPEDIDLALNIDVPTEVVLGRLAQRRVCSECGTNYSVDVPPESDWTCDKCGNAVVQRKDDTQEAITRRLKLYEKETEPLVAWYLERDQLVTVDGVGTQDTVTDRLIRAIDRRRQARR